MTLPADQSAAGPKSRLVKRIARDLIALRNLSTHPVREQLAVLAASAVLGLWEG